MGITIQNVTGSTALVIWPQMAGCADSFYSVMYHASWSSVLSSYSRQSFQKEERVPTSRSWLLVENLTPLTTYVLCVTCQAASPSREQCRTFHTPRQAAAAAGAGGARKELALGIWLASSALLLVIAAVLLYGCLRALCRRRRERPPAPGGGRMRCPRAARGSREGGAPGAPRPGAGGSDAGGGGIPLATIVESPRACQEPVTPGTGANDRAELGHGLEPSSRKQGGH